jgi:hypothetical protein
MADSPHEATSTRRQKPLLTKVQGDQMEGRGMSKNEPKQQQKQAETAAKERVVEEHRRCPICWEGNGGYGTAYSKHGRTRYYKCNQSRTDQGPCGHTWTVLVKLEVLAVEHRIVRMDGER